MLAATACERGAEDGAQSDAPDDAPAVETRADDTEAAPAKGFEGRALLQVNRPQEQLRIRYLSRGTRSRLQIEPVGRPEPGFDVIVEDGRGLVLVHQRREFFDVDLASVPEREESAPEIEVVEHEGRDVVAGLTCSEREIKQGPTTISACVRGLPDEFQTDVFEGVSGMNVPEWVEHLLDEGLWPVRARAQAGGRELYTVEVLQYSPEPVLDQELAVPTGYTRTEPKIPAR